MAKAGFNIGANIKYKIDNVNKEITLTVVDYKDNTTKKVVKTTSRIGETPVLSQEFIY